MTTKQIIALFLCVLTLGCLALSACGDGEESGAESSAGRNTESVSSAADSSAEESSGAVIDILSLPEESNGDDYWIEDLSTENSDESAADSSTEETSSEVSDETSSGIQTNVYRDENGRYSLAGANMPAFAYVYDTFTVCVYGNGVQTTYYSEEISGGTSSSRMDSALVSRNSAIKTAYGVTVQAYRVNDVVATMVDDYIAGTAVYDAAMPFLGGAVALAQEDLLYDLTQFSDTVHLDAPWWDAKTNAQFAIDGTQYFATGDLSVSQKKAAAVVTVDMQMYKTYCEGSNGDLYSLVKSGNWTVDTMFAMAKSVAGVGEIGLSGSCSDATLLYLAAGERFVAVDASGLPTVAIGDTDSTLAVMTLMQLFGNGQVQETGGNALFDIRTLAETERGAQVGIVPVPKLSLLQQEYATPVESAVSYGVCIPVFAKDANFSAYMLEVLACYSKNELTGAYTDSLVYVGNSADLHVREMLEGYVFPNMSVDLGMTCGFGGVDTLLADMAESKTTTVASDLLLAIDAAKSDIGEYVSLYRR